MRTPLFMPPQRGWRIPREEIAEHGAFIDECWALWNKGKDTKDISMILFQPEHIVETAIHLAKERRRAAEIEMP